ncbi:hypothetical protein HU200_012054 [Digitaria exilis]|uniref:Uncharacterized protein n=1 Tax=Digitaria exilis TaxID=1010633 RepID=A0A835FFI2_9POAL|nr:hypothetical protein HU200_012054 [Digitaria exilis]
MARRPPSTAYQGPRLGGGILSVSHICRLQHSPGKGFRRNRTTDGGGGWRRAAGPRSTALQFPVESLREALPPGGVSVSGAGRGVSSARLSPAPGDLEGAGGSAWRRSGATASALLTSMLGLKPGSWGWLSEGKF